LVECHDASLVVAGFVGVLADVEVVASESEHAIEEGREPAGGGKDGDGTTLGAGDAPKVGAEP